MHFFVYTICWYFLRFSFYFFCHFTNIIISKEICVMLNLLFEYRAERLKMRKFKGSSGGPYNLVKKYKPDKAENRASLVLSIW